MNPQELINIHQMGKIAFYSHILANVASEAVARSLALIKYVEDVGYE